MAMDLDDLRYPDFKSLNLYCYRVAGVVGEVAAAIFGGPRSAGVPAFDGFRVGHLTGHHRSQ